tara:strand:+ start:1093 stop:2460 length:1368 start_codon:yes stop_codon:yes gene_type:complete
MATINQLLQYQLLDNRAEKEEYQKEQKAMDRAISNFATISSSSMRTASDYVTAADKTVDRDSLISYKENIKGMKTGVDYVDKGLDAHINHIDLRIKNLDVLTSINKRISGMKGKVASSGEPTKGFLTILDNVEQDLNDNASLMSAPMQRKINADIESARNEVEFVTRMSRFDTDVTTPEIDWEVTGEREVLDKEGKPTGIMAPIYAHNAHTREYIQSQIQPEADVGRTTNEYGFVNKLMALTPGNLRTEALNQDRITRKAVLKGQEEEAKARLTRVHGSAQKSLLTAQGALKTIFGNNKDSNMESLLESTITTLNQFGGESEQARASLDVRKAVRSIERDFNMLSGIVGMSPEPFDMVESTGERNRDTYDPLNLENRLAMDRFIAENIFDPVTGFKKNKFFYMKTGDNSNMPLRTAMKGLLEARELLLQGVDDSVWSYPDVVGKGDSQDVDDNPF